MVCIEIELNSAGPRLMFETESALELKMAFRGNSRLDAIAYIPLVSNRKLRGVFLGHRGL